MATVDEMMKELEALGTAQNRKTYARHGVTSPMFGVSYGNLRPLSKKYKKQHDLALGLWETGNHDARVLATMIADPKKIDGDLMESWVADINDYVVSDAVSGPFGKAAAVQEKMEEWVQSDEEWRGAVGWNLMAGMAMNDKTLRDSYFEPYLDVIESDIHDSKNRVRYSMNSALIAIGTRSEALRERATEVAESIGEVYVDHLETSCLTPDAASYIEKTWNRKKQKEKA